MDWLKTIAISISALISSMLGMDPGVVTNTVPATFVTQVEVVRSIPERVDTSKTVSRTNADQNVNSQTKTINTPSAVVPKIVVDSTKLPIPNPPSKVIVDSAKISTTNQADRTNTISTVLKPQITSISKNVAEPGANIIVYGNNFDKSTTNFISLSNAGRDTGVAGKTSADGKSISFTVIDLISIPAGNYNLAVENKLGQRSNTVSFTIVEPKVNCPAGYTCTPGETDRIQVSSCPVGHVCTIISSNQVIEVKPQITSVSKHVAEPGTNIIVYGINFDKSTTNLISLSNAGRDTGVAGKTSADGKSISFTVMDLVDIPEGHYDLAIENKLGQRSNTVSFTIIAPAIVCPSGYECTPGETDRVQVSSCPVGHVCKNLMTTQEYCPYPLICTQ